MSDDLAKRISVLESALLEAIETLTCANELVAEERLLCAAELKENDRQIERLRAVLENRPSRWPTPTVATESKRRPMADQFETMPAVEAIRQAAIMASDCDLTTAAMAAAIASVVLCRQAVDPLECVLTAVQAAAVVTPEVRRG